MKKILISIFLIFCLVSIARADNWLSPNYIYTNITNDTTTNVKSTPAFLHTFTINKPVASSVIVLSDSNSSITGPAIATITLPATLLSQGPYTATYDATTVNGMTVYTSVASSDVTLTWR